MHNRARSYLLAALPAAPYLVGVGLQVSGRTHAGLAFVAFEIAAIIAAGVAWSYWLDWHQTALAGGHPSRFVHRMLIWPGLKIPWLFTIRSNLIAAIFTLFICNAAIGAFFEITESPHESGVPVSPYQWTLLSADEAAALRGELRETPPLAIGILCASDDCGDLARSFRDVFKDLHWQIMCCGWPFGTLGEGLAVYSKDKSLGTNIAKKIEGATKGRLKVDLIQKFLYDPEKFPVQIVIGEKKL